ncbi:MAG: DNA mismatch endonuclease Vsr [Alphaproteobacteria bacterium]|nr:DNA mismatch endonuclease Vsr [Alphaproteobacteria bacterium]
MADTLTPAERSERMARMRGWDTQPELVVRRLVHGMGYRYRLHRRDLPGTPDMVFPSRKMAIFIHGCFWHRHPDPNCKLARLPKSRLDFWLPKLEANRARDERHRSELAALGWKSLVVWECEIGDSGELKGNIQRFLEGLRAIRRTVRGSRRARNRGKQGGLPRRRGHRA